MSTVTRPALRYHGGKWQLAPWIISFFPEHVCYVEPFGGGGSVLLRKAPAFAEVYNDLNGDVINFFSVLRNRQDELLRAIKLTPYARQEFRAAQRVGAEDDELERARKFYVLAQQGRGRAGVQEPGGWRFMSRNTRSTTPAGDWGRVDHLRAIVQRLKQVQFENDDAATVIRRYDDASTLFYVDPPYVKSSRGARWGAHAYAYEMDDRQHEELAELLHSVEGAVIVSGYPSELYNRLFADWRREVKAVKKDNNGGAATEVLWLSPTVRAANRLV